MSILSDAKILAETILEYWKDYDNGDYSPLYYCCLFCRGNSPKSYNNVKHEIDCPVLVSKDIMTGSNQKEREET